ncbi:hypothetical protein KTT_04430 [Tengunoibacter tsumagoiensis]|uniref:Uncharacterized protein n=1 Tax=Tengunoibacter tsumagoiensis TaxID=2014871 RepID=A0A401ZV36_9CHLR|nr:hypothetical protein KTT_04430 [Tengunoibacter tsumagoiensis]
MLLALGVTATDGIVGSIVGVMEIEPDESLVEGAGVGVVCSGVHAGTGVEQGLEGIEVAIGVGVDPSVGRGVDPPVGIGVGHFPMEVVVAQGNVPPPEPVPPLVIPARLSTNAMLPTRKTRIMTAARVVQP